MESAVAPIWVRCPSGVTFGFTASDWASLQEAFRLAWQKPELQRIFYAGAQATVEGKPLLPQSILKIRDKADREKLEHARRMLADFLARSIGKDREGR
jgi:hypothetical protein